MAKGSSSEVRKLIPQTPTSTEASTGQSAAVDALREGGRPGLGGVEAALGAVRRDDPTAASEPTCPAWPGDTSGLLDALGDHERATVQRLAHAEIELEHKRALLEALDHEQARLQGVMARLEHELDDLDAEMLLCLARDREDHAHTAIRRIIPRRRRIAALRAGIERIATERARLAGSVSRQSLALRASSAPRQGWELHELPARTSTPLSSHRSARSRLGAAGAAFSSAAALASPGRPLRASSREHRGESL